MLTSEDIKKLVTGLGADLCGIASVNRFINSPPGFHPQDIYPDCKSVIVYAKRFPSETLNLQTMMPYTHFSDFIQHELDRISMEAACLLEAEGSRAVPVPSDAPYEYWEPDRSHGMGTLSMRHAGYLAGLGVLGKNTLLINGRFGNMINIGAVLVNMELEPDPMIEEKLCPAGCGICMDSCPQKALDGKTVNQALCRSFSDGKTARGFYLKKCCTCRKVCPHAKKAGF